jgi:hypothetical protein
MLMCRKGIDAAVGPVTQYYSHNNQASAEDVELAFSKTTRVPSHDDPKILHSGSATRI